MFVPVNGSMLHPPTGFLQMSGGISSTSSSPAMSRETSEQLSEAAHSIAYYGAAGSSIVVAPESSATATVTATTPPTPPLPPQPAVAAAAAGIGRQHQRTATASSARNNSSSSRRAASTTRDDTTGGGGGASTTNTATVGRVLAAGLAGLQVYLGTIFGSGTHNTFLGSSTRLRGGEGGGRYYQSQSQRAGHHHTSRRREPSPPRAEHCVCVVSGLSVERQKAVLRRVRYVRPEDEDSCESSGCFGGASATAAREDDIVWVSALPLAEAVPFPSVSTACPVCVASFKSGEEVAMLPCGHLFHFGCIVKWLLQRTTCPHCRADVLLPQGVSYQWGG